MSSGTTENLGLHTWEPTDYVKRDEFNDNFDKIDQVAGDHAAQLAEETQQRLNQINEVIYVKKNKPQYRGVAYGLLEGNTDVDTMLANVKSWDCQIELVVFVSVSDINSTSFATLSAAKMDEFFQKANTAGITISFMAIHLVKNFDDGANGNKQTIKPLPGNESTWFTNYEQAVRFYMEYAKNNGVDHFSIANENLSVSTDPALLSYWIAMINSLKSTYPTIQLSYNNSDPEQAIFIATQKAESDNLLNHLDFISMNVYPRLSENTLYTAGDESLNKMLKSVSLLSIRDTIHALSALYDKEIFISETGCMGLDNSLYEPIYLNQGSDPKPTNNLVQGYYYNGIFNSLALIDAVKGLFIWNYSPPFDFIGKTAETIFEDYMKGE
jgi:hypothetical protein